MDKDRCVVQIDGSNFYNRLKELDIHNLVDFNFLDFTNWLAGSSRIVSRVYHVGAIRSDGSEKAEKMYHDQQDLFASLRKQKIAYKLGYLLKTGGKYQNSSQLKEPK